MPEPDFLMELSADTRQHLIEIMSNETDGTDPACIHCASILRALGINPSTVERQPSREAQFEGALPEIIAVYEDDSLTNSAAQDKTETIAQAAISGHRE
jgi:hypothetical protein